MVALLPAYGADAPAYGLRPAQAAKHLQARSAMCRERSDHMLIQNVIIHSHVRK